MFDRVLNTEVKFGCNSLPISRGEPAWKGNVSVMYISKGNSLYQGWFSFSVKMHQGNIQSEILKNRNVALSKYVIRNNGKSHFPMLFKQGGKQGSSHQVDDFLSSCQTTLGSSITN